MIDALFDVGFECGKRVASVPSLAVCGFIGNRKK